MLEEELIKEGFTRVDVPKIESGDTTDYYYYTYRFDNGWTLISCANDEATDNIWKVYLDNVDDVEVIDMVELIVLMNLVKKWHKSQESG
jgi:hypothetical protein